MVGRLFQPLDIFLSNKRLKAERSYSIYSKASEIETVDYAP
jgi:hypothetical protein